MSRINTKGLLLRIFIPTGVLSFSYLVLGHLCDIPHILLFCFHFIFFGCLFITYFGS